MKQPGPFRAKPRVVIPLSFLAAIAAGTLLLLLPASTAEGAHTDFVTALFTATTSVCVTGLTVVPTAAHWSRFGKAVILLLIQLGGLGVVAVVSLLMVVARRRFTLSGRTLLQDAFGLESGQGAIRFLRRVVRGTLIAEGIGALLYMPFFVPAYGAARGAAVSVFTAVSAFCNAGIDLFGADSIAPWRGHAPVMLITSLLIVLGGLGFVVWFDVLDCLRDRRPSRLSAHTRIVLLSTAFLLLSGTGLFLFSEWGNPDTLGALPAPGRLLNAFFEAVTLRTAGFSAFPQEKMTGLSTLAACAQMFVGGSPIGTAGGIKTATMYLFLLNAYAFVRGRNGTAVFRRRVPEDALRRAGAVVTIGASAVFLLTALLLAAEPVGLGDALFEILSACATVGLSRSLTPSLHTAGRLIVVLSMYLGRIGPLAMAVFFLRPEREAGPLRYARGRFFVG